MTASDPRPASFSQLVDLASATMGGRALACSDDFFAPMERLVRPEPAVFDPDAFTDRGKWMDGWESRRKREPGHDWCIVALGARGVVEAVDVDTSHFLGNHPPFASLEGTAADPDATAEQLAGAEWVELLGQSPLRPGSQNLFTVRQPQPCTHVRLRIYPDGGVARLRVWGSVVPDVAATDGDVDLAAARNGAIAIACSDMFFGSMNNLIAPGRPENMGGGWETRRRRGPGHDWIVVRLAVEGTVSSVEIDTLHFKGNYPDRAAVDGIRAPGARPTDLLADGAPWEELLGEQKLSADVQHVYRDELGARGPFTHVRLRIYPDGGVARLRVHGRPAGAGP